MDKLKKIPKFELFWIVLFILLIAFNSLSFFSTFEPSRGCTLNYIATSLCCFALGIWINNIIIKS